MTDPVESTRRNPKTTESPELDRFEEFMDAVASAAKKYLEGRGPSESPDDTSEFMPRKISILDANGVQTPVFEIEGDLDGPTIAIIGGIHGNETAGYLTAGRFCQRKPQRGTLLVIPRANPPAIDKRKRGAGYDLNREFSRDRDGSTPLAKEICRAVAPADVVIDLHTSIGIAGVDGKAAGVGQAVYSTPNAKSEGVDAVEFFNDRYCSPQRYGLKYKLKHDANQDAEGIQSLVRWCGANGQPAHLVEITSYRTGVETQIQWLYAVTRALLENHGVIVE